MIVFKIKLDVINTLNIGEGDYTGNGHWIYIDTECSSWNCYMTVGSSWRNIQPLLGGLYD